MIGYPSLHGWYWFRRMLSEEGEISFGGCRAVCGQSAGAALVLDYLCPVRIWGCFEIYGEGRRESKMIGS